MIRHDTTSLSILKDSSVLKKKSSDLKDLNFERRTSFNLNPSTDSKKEARVII